MKSACPKRLDYWFVRPCVYISNQTLSCMSCPNSTIPTELMLSVRLQILWWMLDRSLSCTSQSPPHTLCRLPGREFISSAVIQKDKRKDRANLKPVYCLFWAEGQFPWCSICRQGSARSYSVCDCECTVSLIEDFLLSHTELPDVLKEKKSEERESIHESDLLRWLQIALFFSSSPLGLVAVLFFSRVHTGMFPLIRYEKMGSHWGLSAPHCSASQGKWKGALLQPDLLGCNHMAITPSWRAPFILPSHL